MGKVHEGQEIPANEPSESDKDNQNSSKSLVRPQKSISARASSITLRSTLPCFVRSAEKRVHPISTNLKIDLALSLFFPYPVGHPEHEHCTVKHMCTIIRKLSTPAVTVVCSSWLYGLVNLSVKLTASGQFEGGDDHDRPEPGLTRFS